MITGIHHVQLAMPPGEEDRARAFYAGALGFSEVKKPAHLAKRGGAWFQSGSGELHLGVEPGFRAAKKAHPAFLVEDVQKIAEACSAAGYEVVSDEPLPGYDRVYVFDPFGNRIELLKPVIANDRFVGTWRLVSFVGRSADGSETMDFGPTPRGCLMYDKGGRMSVHITHSDASLVYFGYFGTFTVDENSGTVTHHIVGASDSKYAGTDQLRFVTWQGNRLMLTTPPADVTYVATWERQPTDSLG